MLFYCVCSNNMNNTKKAFRKSKVIQNLFWMDTKAKLIKKKNVAKGLKIENLLLTHYSHFLSGSGGG